MSATLGVFLKELEPSLNIEMFETLEGAGLESSDSWNNAGTGHAANCELNYTPERADGSIDISKALQINVEFDLSRQLWSYIVKKGSIKDPRTFIHPVPHMSFVWGAENVSFLRKRFKAMAAHHCYYGMEYTEDRKQIADWTPLVMEGRTNDEPVAATRIVTGTDVDYGSLTNHFVDHLSALTGFVCPLSEPRHGYKPRARRTLARRSPGRQERRSAIGDDQVRLHWSGRRRAAAASEIRHPGGQGIWRLSGQRHLAALRRPRHQQAPSCEGLRKSPARIAAHVGAAPRHSGDRRTALVALRAVCRLLKQFLKHGSLLDLFESVRPGNIKPLLSVARDNFDLTEYLIEQVLQSESHRLAALDQYFPNAKTDDWKLQVAGQRVEIIKPDVKRGGALEFGTELVAAADRSLVALLGASPGASTAAFIAISVLEKCFPNELTAAGWLPKLKEIIPSYGISLIDDADFCRRIRADTAAVLKVENIDCRALRPEESRFDSTRISGGINDLSKTSEHQPAARSAQTMAAVG